MNTFLELADGFGAWVWRASWQTSVLIVLVLVVQWLLRNRSAPGLRYGLWLLVLVRLALPWPPQSRVSIFNWFEPKPAAVMVRSPASASGPEARIAAELSAPPEPAPARLAAAPPTAERSPVEAATTAAAAPASMTQPGKGGSVGLLAVWLTGGALLGLRVLLMNWRLSRRVRPRRPVTDSEVLNLLEDCKQQMRVGTPLHLVQTADVEGPSLYGFIRPRLLLPTDMFQRLSRAELRYVFLHELAHVKRGDIPANWFMTILLVLHWFNPLVWFAFSRMRAARELACDALALSCSPESEAQPYGRTIIKLLESFSPSAAAPGLVGILETRDQITERIAMIAKFRKTNRSPMLALVAIACLTVVALTDAQTARKPVTFTGNPPADLAALRVWSSTNDDLSLSGGVSSDGRYLSYTDGNTGDLMVRDLFKGRDQRLTRIPPDEFWKQYAEASLPSPDGSQVACVWSPRKDPYQLKVMDRSGARSRLLYQDKAVDSIYLYGWSGNGRELLVEFQRGSGKSAQFDITLVSVADGSRRIIKTEGWNGGDRFALTPDGRFLAYDKQSATNVLMREILLMPTTGGPEIPLVQGAWDNRVLGWSPDGRQLLFQSNRRGSFDCWTVRVEAGTAHGDPELVKANLGPVTPIGITRRGSLYYTADVSSSEVQVVKLDLANGSLLGPPRSIASHLGGNRDLHWSLDGKQLVYVSSQDAANTLCVYSMETGQHQEYSPRIGPFFHPAWAADGKSIRVRTQTDTFRLDLATGDTQPLHVGEFFIFPGSNETVAFRFDLGAPQKILRKDLRTGQETVLRTLATNEVFGGGFGRNLSSDGQYLSVGLWRDPYCVLQVIPAAGGEPRDLLSTTNTVSRGGSWLPSNRELLCSVGKELLIVSFDGQPARRLPITQNWTEFHSSPDGQQVAFVVSHAKSELWVLENAVPLAGKIKLARAQQ